MKSEKNLSICAIIISMLALVISIWQGSIAVKHNKLSVQPLLYSIPKLEGDKGDNGIYIANVGLGPAILKNSTLIVNNSRFDLNTNEWPKILEKSNVKELCFKTAWLPNQLAIKSQENTPLLSLTKADLPICSLEMLSFLTRNKISIEVEYVSIYGDQKIMSQELDLIGNIAY